MRKLLVLAIAVPSFAFAGIGNTKHNLKDNANAHFGGYNLCSYCHTAHHAKEAHVLWNRSAPTLAKYNTVTTTDSGTPLPTAATALGKGSQKCLSCHDGSLAMTEVSGTLPGAGTSTNVDYATGKITGGAVLIDNLDGTHPVSVPYAGQTGSLADTSLYGSATTTGCLTGIKNCVTGAGVNGVYIKLEQNTIGGASVLSVECTSCHDPHLERSMFLRNTNPGNLAGVALCTGCHIK